MFDGFGKLLWAVLLVRVCNLLVQEHTKGWLLHVFCRAKPVLQGSNVSIFVRHQAIVKNFLKLHIIFVDIF